MNKYYGLLMTALFLATNGAIASEEKPAQLLQKPKQSLKEVAMWYACASGIIPFFAAVEYTNDSLGRETLDGRRKFLKLRPIGTPELFVRYSLGHYVHKNAKAWPIHCCAIPAVLAWHACKN